eukprot:1141243-Pelagomonas_calceolata.AAC.2
MKDAYASAEATTQELLAQGLGGNGLALDDRHIKYPQREHFLMPKAQKIHALFLTVNLLARSDA